MTFPSGRTLFALLALATAVACSDPTGPSEISSGPIEVGEKHSIRIEAGDTGLFLTFQGEEDSVYAVVVEPASHGVYLTVRDSTSGSVIASTGVIDAATPVQRRATRTFVAPTDGPITVKVQGSSSEIASHAYIAVRLVPTGPEKIGVSIAIGTPATGETLKDHVDLDIFTFTGTTGQIIEPWLSFPAASDEELVACLTIESPAGTRIGRISVAPAGSPTTVLDAGGRIVLPVSGTYTATVGSGWNRCEWWYPYIGGYTLTLRAIDAAPEDVPTVIALEDTVTGESIAQIGDLDRYSLVGPAGSQVVLFLQSLGVGEHGSIRLEVPGVYAIGSNPGDASLDLRATSRATFPDSGKLTVTVTGIRDGPGGDTGSYRFNAYPVDPDPEHNPTAIAIEDSISFEDIERLGDIDRFTFAGVAGQSVNVTHTGALGGAPESGAARLRILTPSGDTLPGGAEASFAHDTTASWIHGRVTLPATGTYVIDIRGYYTPEQWGSQFDHGSYRMYLFGIDTLPEIAPATLVGGDSIIGETIDRPGDLDVYQFEVPTGRTLKLFFTMEPGATGDWILAALIDAATGDTITAMTTYGGSTTETVPVQVPPGSYRLRVQGMEGPASNLHGTYSIRTSAFEWGPETAPDTIAIGDTVTTELIDAAGDIDIFAVHGMKGRSVDVTMASAGGSLMFLAVSPTGVNGPPAATMVSPVGNVALGTRHTGRIDLWQDSLFGVRAWGTEGGYQLLIKDADIEPEAHGAALVVGDTVANESIDAIGDLDRFTLTGTPDDSVTVTFSSVAGAGQPVLEIRDPVTDSLFKSLGGVAPETGVGIIRLPPSGTVLIKVFQPRNWSNVDCLDAGCTAAYTYTGGYTLVVSPTP